MGEPPVSPQDLPGASGARAPAAERAHEVAHEQSRSTRGRLGGAFLGGAGGRLLPASVPFRWFGLALLAHAGAWLALAAAAPGWRDWRGGLGWPLAALHLVTVGTLLASAIGASLQLLPVATRQAVRWPRAVGALWWLFAPGLLLLVVGMGLARPGWLAAGATLVLVVVLAWGLLFGLNLRGARGMPGVVMHGWGALASLLVLAASAAALVALWNGHPLLARELLRSLHLAAGSFGLMGLLVLGLSAILLPMFALGAVPPERRQLRAGGLALAALALAFAAALAPALAPVFALPLQAAAGCLGALTLALHVQMMHGVLRGGMRSDLGRAGRLMRFSWAMAAAMLVLLLVALVDEARGGQAETWATLFVLAAIGGWLLSFLFGVLQRILPFLAAMHAARGRKRPPTPSALTAEAPLAWHAALHMAALALLAIAVWLRSPGWLLAAAAAGFAGATAFGIFFVVLLRRMAS